MEQPNIKRQQGVVAIEFVLGFMILFIFTMVIFETCRLTYISAVLDYATAEAARDARVQLKKNNQFNQYTGVDCDKEYKDSPSQRAECRRVQQMAGNEMTKWFYSFIKHNAGPLWQVFTSAGDYRLKVTAYRDPRAYLAGSPYTGTNAWNEAALAEYEVTYTYRPLMFRASFAERAITRRLLIVQDTALFRSKLRG